jgi:hypothetical protein
MAAANSRTKTFAFETPGHRHPKKSIAQHRPTSPGRPADFSERTAFMMTVYAFLLLLMSPFSRDKGAKQEQSRNATRFRP